MCGVCKLLTTSPTFLEIMCSKLSNLSEKLENFFSRRPYFAKKKLITMYLYHLCQACA
uniref:Uncharacterized protein n=1 Tax=Arundo donax TaxID=35708 RepID=A0A0A9BE85_ARUDO